MDSKMINETRRLFERRLGEAGAGTFYATVAGVDEALRTCSVQAEQGDYDGVLLYAAEKEDLKGLCALPAIGSVVLVARIGGSGALYVAMASVIDKVVMTLGDKVYFSADASQATYTNDKVTIHVTAYQVEIDADKVVFNSGELGGLVKIEELKKNLDSLKQFVEAMHAATPVGIAAVGAAMAANGVNGKTAYDGAMAGKAVTLGDMEDTKITH